MNFYGVVVVGHTICCVGAVVLFSLSSNLSAVADVVMWQEKCCKKKTNHILVFKRSCVGRRLEKGRVCETSASNPGRVESDFIRMKRMVKHRFLWCQIGWVIMWCWNCSNPSVFAPGVSILRIVLGRQTRVASVPRKSQQNPHRKRFQNKSRH